MKLVTRLRYYEPRQAYARLTSMGDSLAFESSYDAGLVAAFKQAIPPNGRRWDPIGKYWLVDPAYAATCKTLAQDWLGIGISLPSVSTTTVTETVLLKLEYLGACKPRDDGESAANGYVNGGWNFIIPEQVLQDWFEILPQAPGEKSTLFAVLAIKPDATPDDVKSAFRRMAKLHHPDVNKEPTAHEDFKTVNHAYEILIDPMKRKKYAAGLALQRGMGARDSGRSNYGPSGYRSPLRCGWVMVEARQSLGRYVIGKILDWQDIVRSDGAVAVASWPQGGNHFEVQYR